VSELATVRTAAGLVPYLAAVEARLADVVAGYPGTVAAVGTDALAGEGEGDLDGEPGLARRRGPRDHKE